MTSDSDYVFGKVIGVHPNTGEKAESILYTHITPTNVDEVFCERKCAKPGTEIFGTKAVAYKTFEGPVRVAFFTETINTHHRHGLARLIGLDVPEARALYDGDYDGAGYIIDRSAGFELRYDRLAGIVGKLKQDSQITKQQQARGRVLRRELQEEMALELLSRVPQDMLCQRLKELDIFDDDRIFLTNPGEHI